MVKDCLFCDSYSQWEREGKILNNNRGAYSILSVTPATPGAVIVVPKKHLLVRPRLMDMVDIGLMINSGVLARDQVERIVKDRPRELQKVYEKLVENPPFSDAGIYAQEMLEWFRPGEDIIQGWNLGINIGEAAGQSQAHFHVHLVPRYGTTRTGVVTAFRNEFL